MRKLHDSGIYRFLAVSFVIGLSYVCLAFSASAIEDQHNVAKSFGGTRLYAGDSIVISPKGDVLKYSQTTTDDSKTGSNPSFVDPQCYSIRNSSTKDYFVPWRTDNEWTKFLAAVDAGTVP